jgi:hypothetical protein
MLKIYHSATLVILCVAANGAQAASLSATSLNLKSVFASAAPGDTIRLTGDFGSVNLSNRNFSSTVTIDATKARFNDSLSIYSVTNLKIYGGTFGSATTATRNARAIGIFNSNNIVLQKNTVIGNGSGMGVTFQNVTNGSVVSGSFSNLKLGLGVTSSRDIRISSNLFNRMSSDGVNIADSHRVLASTNTCSGTIVGPGNHPDCIQLWSLAGRPVQSDITLSKNTATGATQGFTSFDPDRGGGLRISMLNNIVSTSYPQGIACYNCVDSKFTGNVLTTLPGARWRTSMNIVGGSNNTIAYNSIGPLPINSVTTLSDSRLADPDDGSWVDDTMLDLFNDDFARFAADEPDTSDNLAELQDPSMFGALASARGFGFNSASAVPEPATWIQIILGFGLAGAVCRKPRRVNKLAH